LLFAPDTIADIEFLVALVNTVPGATRTGLDELHTPEQLTALLSEHRYSGRFDRDAAELADVLETRERFRRMWQLDRDGLVTEINAMLEEAHAFPQLRRHDGLDWHFHGTPLDAPLAERMRVEVALGIADLVRADSTDRMRACDAYDCDGLFVDLSRNGSRRFCSIRCGNRMNMVAFRERAHPPVD
jgi:predicted RNA-binding Zn ribbon-like protein